MTYNDHFKARALFMDDTLRNVIPQVSEEELRSGAIDIKNSVASYLESVLNAKVSGGELTVVGDKKDVMRKIERLSASMASYVEYSPNIIKGLRCNARLYTEQRSKSELKTMTAERRLEVLDTVIENFMYNPDIVGELNPHTERGKRQRQWKDKVGYKEK